MDEDEDEVSVPPPDEELPPPTEGPEVPDLTPDQTQFDLFLQELFGITAHPDDDLLMFLPQDIPPEKFQIQLVDPIYRTSFVATSLTEAGIVSQGLPASMPLTGSGTTRLTLDDPSQIGNLISPYRDQITVFDPSAPVTQTTGDVVAVSMQIQGNLTDPGVCTGQDFTFALNINNPVGAPPWVANPAFPGDYYQGGNTFPNFSLSNCTPSTWLDQTAADGSITSSGLPGFGLMHVNPAGDMTTVVLLVPADVAPPDGTVHSIFFEHPTGQPFTETNTRFQSAPDLFGPPVLIGDAPATGDCDWSLVGPELEQPVPVGPTDGGETDDGETDGGDTEDGENAGGAGGAAGGGAEGGATDGEGTGTPGTTSTPTTPTTTTTTTVGDETDAAVIAASIASLVLGAVGIVTGMPSVLAGPTAGRREDGEAMPETGPPPAGGQPVVPKGAAEVKQAETERADAEAEANEAALERARQVREAAEVTYADALSDVRRLEASEAREWFTEKFLDWVTDDDKTEADMMKFAKERLAKAEAELRAAIGQEIAAEALFGEADLEAALDGLFEEAMERDKKLLEKLFDEVPELMELPENDDYRARMLAMWESEHGIGAFLKEAVLLARNASDPERFDLRQILDGLALGMHDSQNSLDRHGDDTEFDHKARVWWRQLERQHQIDTYQVLAELGTYLDADGAVVVGPLRQRLAGDRLAWLVADLEQAGWRRDDIRLREAAEIRGDIAQHYRHLALVGADADMTEYFLAVAQSIRQVQTERRTWFRETYLGFSKDDTGTWWDEFGWRFRTGLGTRLRANDLDPAGEGMSAVMARLDAMDVEADAAVALLNRAAEAKKPENLAKEDFEALRQMGYIERTNEGWRFRVPKVDYTAARSTAVELPGASWLDPLSAKNALTVVVSVALPELAAARVGALALRLGLSNEAALTIRLLVDFGIGTAMDVGLKWWETPAGKFELKKAALDAALQSALGLIGKVGTDKAVAAGADRILGEALTPASRAAILESAQAFFGMPVEAITQLGYQYVADGKVATMDDFLAALVNAGLSRGASKYSGKAADRVERAIAEAPPAVRTWLAAQPDLVLAIKVDAAETDAAVAKFDEIMGDTPIDAAAGKPIFEALRRGDLTWDQLQRVFTRRGDQMLPAMTEVAKQRDAFTRRVEARARARAREEIPRHFEGLREQARAELSGEQLATRLAEIDREQAAELAKLGDPEAEARVRSEYTARMDELANASPDELREFIRNDARAKEEVVPADLDSLTQAELAVRALDRHEQNMLVAITKASKDIITPGSASPTSDVDRSWSSEFFRRAAKAEILAEMMKGRMDSELGPTTARAFDVNEYVNTMLAITRFIEQRPVFADLPVSVMVADGSGGAREVTLPHRDVVEANTIAGAMLHMDAEKRAQYEANRLEGLEGAARQRMVDMLAIAKRELAVSEVELNRYIEIERAKPDAPKLESELELRARDALYGDRMARLDELANRIDALDADDPRRAELLSQWERGVNQALRDGIETYSDISNLDIIVSRMQAKKGLTPSDLMGEADFRLGEGGLLEHLTPQQINGMYNDQVLMLMHHIEAVMHGHESPQKAARSIAKYAERALLALKLRGDFDPANPGPLKDLFEKAQALMKHKSSPSEQLALLREWGGGDERVGIRDLLDQLEKLPDMQGLTKGEIQAFRGDFEALKGESAAARFVERNWIREAEAAAEQGRLDEMVGTSLAEVEAEIRLLEGRLKDLEMLGGLRPQDRAAYLRKRAELRALELRMLNVSDSLEIDLGERERTVHPEYREWSERAQLLRGELEAMEAWGAQDGRQADDPMVEETEEVTNRLEQARARRRFITSFVEGRAAQRS